VTQCGFFERAFKRALFFCVRPQIFAIFPTNYTIDKKKTVRKMQMQKDKKGVSLSVLWTVP
jgi:hypothetical protein